MALQTLTHRLCGQVVVCVTGDVDASNAEELVAYLFLVLAEQETPRVVINLSGLEFVDSAGLTALIEARLHARRCGGDVHLASMRPQIRRVLRASGLDQTLAIYSTVDDALFGGMHREAGPA